MAGPAGPLATALLVTCDMVQCMVKYFTEHANLFSGAKGK